MLRRGAQGLTPYDDDVMVWISQLIDQDVNIFYGPELVATSERDLFASGLLPTRTADDVYRAIALERLPSYRRARTASAAFRTCSRRRRSGPAGATRS